jgi:hypothetical protein
MSLGRPLGLRSPWSMARAQTFGTDHVELVPRRVVPSLFSRTNALSNPRAVALGPYTVEINAGPARLPCCLERAPRRLVELAPDAAPRAAIRPYSGAALESRPWVQHHFVAQTPLCRWPADDDRDAGPCVVASPR